MTSFSKGKNPTILDTVFEIRTKNR